MIADLLHRQSASPLEKLLASILYETGLPGSWAVSQIFLQSLF